MKSLKEFINEELQNSNTVIQENTELTNDNKKENIRESQNVEARETQ